MGTRLEISHNAPHTSPLSQGEKRKSTSPDNGGGQKKARPFSMSFGVKSKSGGEATSVEKDVGGDSAEGRNVGRTKTAVIQPIRSITMKLMQVGSIQVIVKFYGPRGKHKRLSTENSCLVGMSP